MYSLGISGSQLAQYLAFAEYAWTEFHPQIMVFVVVGNDFDESLKKYKQAPGYYHFEEQGLNHELKLMRIDYRPSTGKKLLRHSALVRYLWGTVGVSAIAQWIKPAGDYVGNTAAYASESRLADSRRAVDQFFAELPRRVPLDRSRILFVLDAMRPGIYSDADLDRTAGSYFNLMRQHFLHSGEAHGYEVIDMQPRFIARHRKDGSRFEFATDNHWNSFGHEEVAAAVASSGVLKAFVPL